MADGTCGAAETDAGTGDGATPGSDATAAGCTPNHDGQITADELPLVAGRSATFRIATGNVTVDTTGTVNTDRSLSWDLSKQLSGDADQTVMLASPSGAWWASDFATASYSTTLSASSDLVGVFQVTASAVELLGVVSPASNGGTELTYDPPAKILAIPFKAGDTWNSTSTVSGTASGVPSAYTETYASTVDQVGTMTTPYGMFPVLRVATDLTRTEGVTTLASTRTFSWNAECFGAVATITSQDFETKAEFTDAAEVQRIAP